MKLEKTDYRNSVDSIKAFIEDKLQASDNPECRIKLQDLYKRYEEYCHSEERGDIESKDTLKKALKDLKYEVKCSTRDGKMLIHGSGLTWMRNVNLLLF
jgi:phage/plasmid-associated DNA primase